MDEAIAAGTRTALPAAPTLSAQALPAAVDQGNDAGLINIAYNLPLAVAPLAAGVLPGLPDSCPASFTPAGIVTITAA